VTAWFADAGGKNVSVLRPEGAIETWSIETGHRVAKLELGRVSIRWAQAVDTGEDRLRLLTSSGRSIRLWEISPRSLPSRALSLSPRRGEDPVPGFLAAHDGAAGTLAIVEQGGHLTFYRVAAEPDGGLVELKSVRAPGDRIRSPQMSPGGRQFAGIVEESIVRVWNVETGQLSATIDGHEGSISALCFVQGGRLVATSSLDRTIRLWNADDGSFVAKLLGNQTQTLGLAAAPDGSALATWSPGEALRVWDVRRTAELERLRHPQGINHASFSSDGRRIVTASRDKTARIWSIDDLADRLELRGHSSYLTCAVFHRGDAEVLTTAWDRTLRRWNAKTGAEIASVELEREAARIFLSSDDRLALLGGKEYLAVHDANTLALIARSEGPPGNLFDACFSPDGKSVATGTDKTTVGLWSWDGVRLAKVRELEHEGRAASARYSPDGRLLVTADRSGAVTVWEVPSYQPVRVIRLSRGASHAEFSRDGRRIASCGVDGAVGVWETDTGGEVMRVNAHAVGARDLTFSPDGRFLLTASHDGTARLLRLEPLPVARERSTRVLTAEERASLGIEPAPEPPARP